MKITQKMLDVLILNYNPKDPEELIWTQRCYDMFMLLNDRTSKATKSPYKLKSAFELAIGEYVSTWSCVFGAILAGYKIGQGQKPLPNYCPLIGCTSRVYTKLYRIAYNREKQKISKSTEYCIDSSTVL